MPIETEQELNFYKLHQNFYLMETLCREYAEFQIPQPRSDNKVPGIEEDRGVALDKYDYDSLEAFLKEKGYVPFKENIADDQTFGYPFGKSSFMTVYAIIHWVIFAGLFVAMCFVGFSLIKDDYFGSVPFYKILLACVAASAILLAYPAYLWHKFYGFVEDTAEETARKKREKRRAEKQKQLDELKAKNEKWRSALTEQFYSDFEVRCAAERSMAHHKDVLARDELIKTKKEEKRNLVIRFKALYDENKENDCIADKYKFDPKALDAIYEICMYSKWTTIKNLDLNVMIQKSFLLDMPPVPCGENVFINTAIYREMLNLSS